MSALRRLVFHIGLEKTGTTSLQACLHHNPAVLKRHSVLYPSHNLAFGWQNHKPLVGCYDIGDAGDKWMEADPSRRAEIVASLVHEIEASKQEIAIVSAEHFSSRFREPQIRQLREDFRQFDCRVLVVVRDHVSRLRSMYETYVTNGGVQSLDEYTRGAMRRASFDLRYAGLLAGWKRVFGRDRIDIVAYGPDVLRDVLRRLSPGLEDGSTAEGIWLRASAGADVVAALRLANLAAAHSSAGAWGATWLRDRQRRLQVRRWLQQSVTPEMPADIPLDDDLLARLNEMAASDAASLKATYGFVMPEPEAPPTIEAGHHDQIAELLARALFARVSKPWTPASLIGTGLAVAKSTRDVATAFRRRRKKLL